MADTYDLIIRGGTIIDGSGAAMFKGDVAIANGLIQAVGTVTGQAREEIDAEGKLVTPGFVDIHTHYDGQVTWENTLSPSSDHGVTTVVMGNCGVGFAPCRPSERDMLVKVMEGVEDIPEVVMAKGVPWLWESFEEYLDFLSGRHFDADCASLLPHAALRLFVMGERGVKGGPSTEDDRQRMKELVTQAVKAGALGVASSRSLFHRDSAGGVAPHVLSGREELLALAEGLRDAGTGIFELAASLGDQQAEEFMPEKKAYVSPEQKVRDEVALIHDLARTSGRPITFAVTVFKEAPDMYKQILAEVAKANTQGATIRPQVLPRPIGMLLGLDLSVHPFKLHPSYREIENLPLAERVAKMRDPEVRARILAEQPDADYPDPILRFTVSRSLDSYVFGDELNYEPKAEASLEALAAKHGVSIWEEAYDRLIEGDGKNILFQPLNNLHNNSLDTVHDIMAHPDSLIGLGDGGAHYGLICDASFPTFVLTHWARDRDGARFTLPEVVHWMTRRNAMFVGLEDRGLVAPGLKADINVIDFDHLRLHKPEVVYNLPGGGRRIRQAATGYEATIVNGRVTYRNGKATGELPGRLVRQPRHEPDATRGSRSQNAPCTPFG